MVADGQAAEHVVDMASLMSSIELRRDAVRATCSCGGGRNQSECQEPEDSSDAKSARSTRIQDLCHPTVGCSAAFTLFAEVGQ